MSYDTNWDDVSLLLQFNGSNGGTTFTDSSPLAHTVTAFGNAQLSDSSPKFGSAALLLDGTGDYATIPYHADLHLESGDFTIECWVKASSSDRTLLTFGTSGGTIGWELYRHSGGYMRFASYNSSGTFYQLAQSSGNIADGSWHHLAVTRSGNTWRLFYDGALADSNTFTHNIRGSSGTYRVVLGAATSASGGYWNGRVDDLRITAGVARYTAAFTAPTAEFPDEGPPAEGRISAAGPLQAPQLRGTVHAGSIAAAGPLQAASALAAQSRGAIAADGPLGAAAALGAVRNGIVAADGPLGAPAALGGQWRGWAEAAGPLGVAQLRATHHGGSIAAASPLDGQQAALRGHHQPGRIAAPSPLGAGSVLAHQRAALIAAASPLGIGRAVAWHDFTPQIDPDAAQRYVMDLVTPSGLVRVPISSWQATLQSGAANYLQCVIPGAGAWASQIAAATHFVISRVSSANDGALVVYEMARAPVDTLQDARGPTSRSVTLSGYTDAFASSSNPSTVYDRRLRNVRQVFISGGVRARADIDWLLRPGMRAYVDDSTAIVVRYVNLYATSAGDNYCDVGSAA